MELKESRGKSGPVAGWALPGLEGVMNRQLLTLAELERRSGVSYTTVHKLMHLKRGAYRPTIEKLSTALEVEPAELTGSEPKRMIHGEVREDQT